MSFSTCKNLPEKSHLYSCSLCQCDCWVVVSWPEEVLDQHPVKPGPLPLCTTPSHAPTIPFTSLETLRKRDRVGASLASYLVQTAIQVKFLNNKKGGMVVTCMRWSTLRLHEATVSSSSWTDSSHRSLISFNLSSSWSSNPGTWSSDAPLSFTTWKTCFTWISKAQWEFWII